jgi:DNA invertase Pin-like site-specific DNA recombinase
LVEAGHVDVVMLYKRDRLTCRVADMDKLIKRLERHDVALVSLQDSLDITTVTGRLIMNLLASASQREREVIGERSRGALPHLKSQGKYHCYPRFGQPPEAPAILAMMPAARAQRHSSEPTAEELNSGSVPSTLGGRWYAVAVRRMVLRNQSREERRVA